MEKKSFLYIKNYFINIGIILGLSILLSIFGTLLSSVFSVEVVKRFMSSPLLFLMNTLPVSLLMLFFYFLSSRLWVSYFGAGSIYLFIQLINGFKVRLRQEPLVPADFLLGNETTKVIKLSQLPLNQNITLLIVSFLLISIVLFFFVKSKKLNLFNKIMGALFMFGI